MIYRSVSELDFNLGDVPALPVPRRVLMTSPEYFDVEYVINPHMAGHIGDINQAAARLQWDALRRSYVRLGIETEIVDGLEGLPDMVFCANQTLPFYRVPVGGERKGVVLSRMFAPERMDEVERYARFFSHMGYETLALASESATSFEGMGDGIWHPTRDLLWGGYGFRTDASAYTQIAEDLDVRILLLELTDPDFYHLDTCFSVLDRDTALIYPGAFQEDGLDLIRSFFSTIIESPEDEARTLFSCNAHSPDGKNVILQEGCTLTNQRLRASGFELIELDTSEFLKAGGSVFCMKQMFW